MCPIKKFPESELAKISFILPPSLEFPNYSFEKTESCAALCRGKTSKIISFQIDKRGKVILILSSLKPIVQKNHHRPQKPPKIGFAVYSSGYPVGCLGVCVWLPCFAGVVLTLLLVPNNTDGLWPDHRQATHHHHPCSAFALRQQQLEEIMTVDFISRKIPLSDTQRAGKLPPEVVFWG